MASNLGLQQLKLSCRGPPSTKLPAHPLKGDFCIFPGEPLSRYPFSMPARITHYSRKQALSIQQNLPHIRLRPEAVEGSSWRKSRSFRPDAQPFMSPWSTFSPAHLLLHPSVIGLTCIIADAPTLVRNMCINYSTKILSNSSKDSFIKAQDILTKLYRGRPSNTNKICWNDLCSFQFS